MKRDRRIIGGCGLLAALLLLGGVGLLLMPTTAPRILPAGAVVTRIARHGPGRLTLEVQLPQRQSAQSVYGHLTATGWRSRRLNIDRHDDDRTFVRRSARGYMLETVIVQRHERRGRLTLLYQRCIWRVSCSWR